MASFSRTVTVNWQGSLLEGKGTAVAGTGAFSLPVSFSTRVADAQGLTSPEELIAAAHASCYAMALNATLGRRGGAAERTDVTATVTADKGDSGIKITTSKLTVVAHGLTGIAKDQFGEVARAAEQGCPVSNALRGSLNIDLDAKAE